MYRVFSKQTLNLFIAYILSIKFLAIPVLNTYREWFSGLTWEAGKKRRGNKNEMYSGFGIITYFPKQTR
jgi:hypothetical protein